MQRKKDFNTRIIGAAVEVTRAVDKTPELETLRDNFRETESVTADLTQTPVNFGKPTIVTVLNRVLVDQVYTNRGEYEKQSGLNVSKAIAKMKGDDELSEFYAKHRVGLQLTPAEKTFFYECLFPLYNQQCINHADPKNKYFLVNSQTGRRGDIVIGVCDGNSLKIFWEELYNIFAEASGAASAKKTKTKAAAKTNLKKRDDQIQNFKKMVSAITTDPKKCFIVKYLEQNEFGEEVTTEEITQPLTLGTVEKDGVKYVVLRFAKYFIYGDGNAITKYRPASASLLRAIQSSVKATNNAQIRTATSNLLCQIRTYMSANIKKLGFDKERTKKYNEEKKTKGKAYIIRRKLLVKTLIYSTSFADVQNRRHDKARDVLKKAIKNLKDGGVIYEIKGETPEFAEWWTTGNRPDKYRTWDDFYKKEGLILYIVKDV